MFDTPLPVVQFLRDGLDPVPELARLREEQPVSLLELPFGPPVWLVTRHDDVRAVLGDAERFGSDFTQLTDADGLEVFAQLNPGGLGFADPPDHTRLRRMLTPEFTMRRLRRLEGRIDAIVGDLLDGMAAAGKADLVTDFAVPLPSLVICELLGVPGEERAEFERLSTARFDVLNNLEACLEAVQESLAFIRVLVERERAESGDGMLGMLIREHGDDITDEELTGLADGVLTGGHETTASMLALGAIRLLRDPGLRERALDGRVGEAVEELLRHLTVVQVAFPRLARKEVELGGRLIEPGHVVLCSLSSANRDPAALADPHVAFGYGIHRCVGAELGRMELRAAYPALFRRFPGLRLAVPFEELRFREMSIVYGVESLPVEW